jgi:hypothetical protein
LRHTNMKMDPRTRDLGMLIMTALAIEGTRIMRVVGRRSAQASAAKAEQAQREGAGGRVIEIEPGRRPVGI